MNKEDTVFFFPSASSEEYNLLAVGVESSFTCEFASKSDWDKLDNWLAEKADWKFGWISYDAKNAIENLQSRNFDHLRFPQIQFVIPEHVIRWNSGGRTILKGQWKDEFDTFLEDQSTANCSGLKLQSRMSKEDYLHAINQVLKFIQRGDIYELNFCQEFYSNQKLDKPLETWKLLRANTQAPFSVFVRHQHYHVLCASPERYIRKEGQRIFSQPIKGTIRRGLTEREDELLKNQLKMDEKERSENVMIVDLVRNDLSKSALRGSVRVDELFGVHSFKTVHHLISTVSADLRDKITFGKIIKDTFPMGSMTGAPKVRSMELIDELEWSGRGLYSGTVGYIDPNGDFDFNVVIRSLLYNSESHYMSCSVGGAITAKSIPLSEYDECLLKAKAVMNSL